jgi:5S rRNA maturation endonuclease (ribonuclease M5)
MIQLTSKTGENESDVSRICSQCGQTIRKDDIWYPFFDISRCGGGILYLDARCAVERVLSRGEDKQDLLKRVTDAVRETEEAFSDGLMNFYWVFPISPIHWVQFFALGDDFEEVDILTRVNAQRPSCILIVEGKDDKAILQQLLAKTKLDVTKIVLTTGAHAGGWEDAIRTVEFLKRIRLEIPCFVVLDSNGDPKGKLSALTKLGVTEKNAHVLKKKEIESYIIDPQALSKVLNADSDEIARELAEIKIKGKGKLETIFKKRGLPNPDDQVKGLIARALPSVPDEIMSLAKRIIETMSHETG